MKKLWQWFLNKPLWLRLLTVVILGIIVRLLVDSTSELNAVAWHARHGNHVTVNGVTFPLCLWQLPHVEPNGFLITTPDAKGPLHIKSGCDNFFVIRVTAHDDKPGTPEQKVQADVAHFKSENDTGIQRFQTSLSKEPMQCVETAFEFHCYGSGPIDSVYVLGLASHQQIMDMMAAVK